MGMVVKFEREKLKGKDAIKATLLWPVCYRSICPFNQHYYDKGTGKCYCMEMDQRKIEKEGCHVDV